VGKVSPVLGVLILSLDLLKVQAYWGRLTLLCSKNAGIRAALVSENSGAIPSYIKRSLASSQKFLFKYLSVVFIPRGSNIQLIVAFLSLSKEAEGRKPNSVHTRVFVPTWICSSLEISADTVRNEEDGPFCDQSFGNCMVRMSNPSICYSFCLQF